MARVEVRINGTKHAFDTGTTVASAILSAGINGFRKSAGGKPRGPLCGMGICFECSVTIDGASHQRTCQIALREGMEIETDG